MDFQDTSPSKRSRNRKRNQSRSDQNDFHELMPNPLGFSSKRIEEPGDALNMITGESRIYLNTPTTMIYSPTNLSYDRAAIARPDIWHQVIIHHNGAYTKTQILKSFCHLLQEEEFFPIAYREYDDYDFFLLRQSNKALIKLFSRGLQIAVMIEDPLVDLTVKFSVGMFVGGQIFPTGKITQAINERFINAEMYGDKHSLNFDSFAAHSELQEISLSLSNRSTFELFCNTILKNENLVNTITHLKLAYNNIYTVVPLEKLSKMSITSLDLRHNCIRSIQQFKSLKALNLTELFVAGNLCANKFDHTDQLREIFPDLCRIDDLIIKKVDSTNMPKHLRHLRTDDLYIDEIQETVVIQPNNVDLNYFKKFSSSEKWHQMVVHHEGKFNKTQILDMLFTLIEDYEFIPCYYKSYAKCDEFFVRKCAEALETLLKQRLVLSMPFSTEKVTLVLKVNVAEYHVGQVDVNTKMITIAAENLVNKTLDLDNFHEIPILKNLSMYLSYPACAFSVFKICARKQSTNIQAIQLRHNNIKNCKVLGPLNWFSRCTSLDLRHNQISHFDDMMDVPKNNRITELWLDHNPICNNVGSTDAYVKGLKKLFPDLQTLDGVVLPTNQIWIERQNFLCKPEAVVLAEDFVKHYFNLYDSPQRGSLKEMYSVSAMLTVSMYYDPSKLKDNVPVKIKPYATCFRNILRMSNYSDSHDKVFRGHERIMQVLNGLPTSVHDFYSFTIDVTSYTPRMVCLTVSGIFKEPGLRILDKDFMMNFTRTFVLRPVARNKGLFQKSVEYKILNDMLYVTNLTYMQVKDAFNVQPPLNESLIPVQEEKESVLIVFRELTSLGHAWAYKIMEDSSWNIKMALKMFMELYGGDKIPTDGFSEEF